MLGIGPLHTQDWEPVTITLQHSHWWKQRSRSKLAWLRGQWSMWMQDGCKVYMNSYMALDGSCFMVSWTIFNNHLLEVGLTQIRRPQHFRTLTTVGLLHFIMCEDPHERKFIELAFGWVPNHIWLHTTLEDPWPHYIIFGGVLGWPFNTFLWSQLLARVWSDPYIWAVYD